VIGLNVVVVFLYYGDGVLQTEMGFKIFKKFYVDLEQNIPTFFNTMLLLTVSLLLFFIYLLNRVRTLDNNRPWLILFFTFLFLTIDENASAHEIFVTILPKYFGIGGDGFLKFAWVIPYGIFAFLFAIYFIRFLRSININIALGFIIAGSIYVAGAIGIEMVSSKIASIDGNENLLYALTATLEETLEMGGLIVFVYFLLKYINIEYKVIELHVPSFAYERKRE
jgi:hypothetical protein